MAPEMTRKDKERQEKDKEGRKETIGSKGEAVDDPGQRSVEQDASEDPAGERLANSGPDRRRRLEEKQKPHPFAIACFEIIRKTYQMLKTMAWAAWAAPSMRWTWFWLALFFWLGLVCRREKMDCEKIAVPVEGSVGNGSARRTQAAKSKKNASRAKTDGLRCRIDKKRAYLWLWRVVKAVGLRQSEDWRERERVGEMRSETGGRGKRERERGRESKQREKGRRKKRGLGQAHWGVGWSFSSGPRGRKTVGPGDASGGMASLGAPKYRACRRWKGVIFREHHTGTAAGSCLAGD